MNIRTTLTTAVADYLESKNSPIPLLRDCSDDVVSPPYALVRIGGAEAMAPGQCELWDITLLIAVSHDADATTNATAEREAGEVFELLTDTDDFKAFTGDKILLSAVEMISTELAVQDGHWQHIAGFRVICAPAD